MDVAKVMAGLMSAVYKNIAAGIAVLVIVLGLHLSSLSSYLLFHSPAEQFCIVIAVCMFVVTWNSRRYINTLNKANERLVDLDRQKSDFFNKVAHDLRTPLTSIKGYTELLRIYQNEPNEVRQEFLDIISKESDRLGHLISNFLDMARIEAGTMQFEKAPIDLRELVRHSLTLFEEEAQGRRIRLKMQMAPEPLPVQGDRRRLEQVLANLLSNAVKCSPEGGEILLEAQKMPAGWGPLGPSWIEVSVADAGQGIEPNDQLRVFEKFGQVQNQENRVKGTGLGLAISREIVAHHGGSIWVESEPGKGARFVFTLPLDKSGEASPQDPGPSQESH